VAPRAPGALLVGVHAHADVEDDRHRARRRRSRVAEARRSLARMASVAPRPLVVTLTIVVRRRVGLRDTIAPDFVFLAKNSWRVGVTRKYWFDPARMRSLVAAQPRWDLRVFVATRLRAFVAQAS
jgi:hypothetical protein